MKFLINYRFGVCCVFLNTGAATATITENRTRLRNSEYPSIATATTAQTIVYTVNKMNAGIHQTDNFQKTWNYLGCK